MTVRCAPPRITARDTRRVRPPPKAAAPIYGTPQYKAWRAAVVARAGGRCQDPLCRNPPRRTRLFADHIMELRDGGEAFALSNGMARCGSCHSRKTAAERARRMGIQ